MTSESEAHFAKLREEMVTRQLEQRGIEDPRLLAAMQSVPRHNFVSEDLKSAAYEDRALSIGPDQSISQPFIVAYMINAAALQPTDSVLEIGTGSGYQTAVLSDLVAKVYSIEIDANLSEKAQERLLSMGYNNVIYKVDDGYRGWSEFAPFDAILVSAAPTSIPRSLLTQLKDEGRMVLPFGDMVQELVMLRKTSQGLKTEELGGVRFVPMKGGEAD